MTNLKTNTETNNFESVMVSTCVLESGTIETMIFFNGTEIYSNSARKDVERQHEIGVRIAEKYNLYYGHPYSEPLFVNC